MLPNHSPLVVAEQFGTLGALHQNRIDLGIGRAPGTDPATAQAWCTAMPTVSDRSSCSERWRKLVPPTGRAGGLGSGAALLGVILAGIGVRSRQGRFDGGVRVR